MNALKEQIVPSELRTDRQYITCHAAAAITLCQLGVMIDKIPETSDLEEAKKIVERTLDLVQSNFYLTPKLMASEDDFVDRPVPEDAFTDSLSELWNNVSN